MRRPMRATATRTGRFLTAMEPAGECEEVLHLLEEKRQKIHVSIELARRVMIDLAKTGEGRSPDAGPWWQTRPAPERTFPQSDAYLS